MEDKTEYEEINPAIWKPEKEGDSIEGTLVSKETMGSYESNAYNIQNTEGRFLVWGSAVLDQRMQYVEIGERVKIEFKRTELNDKKQKLKIYKVYKAKHA